MCSTLQSHGVNPVLIKQGQQLYSYKLANAINILIIQSTNKLYKLIITFI